MRFNPRLTAALAGVAVTALTLAACSSSGGSGGAGSSGSASPSSSAASSGGSSGGNYVPADLSGQHLEVAAVWSGAEQTNFQAVLKDFENKTHATVTFTSTGNDIATVLGTRIKGGKAPDVAILPNPGLLNQYAKAGDLTPANADVTAMVDAHFAPVWKTLASVNGKLYGVYFKAANKSTVWYRTAAFTQAGITPPKTWADFLKALSTLSDSGTTPLCVGAGDGWPLTDWFEEVYLKTAGVDAYNKLQLTHTIKWTDPTVTTALQDLAQVFKNNYIAGGLKGSLQTDFNTSATDTFGSNPKCAMSAGATSTMLRGGASSMPIVSIGTSESPATSEPWLPPPA